MPDEVFHADYGVVWQERHFPGLLDATSLVVHCPDSLWASIKLTDLMGFPLWERGVHDVLRARYVVLAAVFVHYTVGPEQRKVRELAERLSTANRQDAKVYMIDPDDVYLTVRSASIIVRILMTILVRILMQLDSMLLPWLELPAMVVWSDVFCATAMHSMLLMAGVIFSDQHYSMLVRWLGLPVLAV